MTGSTESDKNEARPMSVRSYLDDYGLTPQEFRVYGRVWRRWNEKDGCFESSRRMAKGCQMSDRTVRNCLFVLVAARLLKRTDLGQNLTLRYDPMPRESWANPSCLPILRKQAQGYRKGAVHKTPAVHEQQECGTSAPKSAVRETHEGNPMKVVPLKGKSPNGDGGKGRRASREEIELFKQREGLIAYLKDRLGGKPLPDLKMQKAAALWLLQHGGYTAEECKECLDSQLESEWREKADWKTVKQGIAQYQRKKGRRRNGANKNEPVSGRTGGKDQAPEQSSAGERSGSRKPTPAV